jgi:hypothetical protein
MEQTINELEVNGIKYIRKDSIVQNTMASNTDGLPFVIIRTYSAGVHIGYLASRNGKEVKLLKSIRIWYWTGAASISQLAVEGTTKPNDCKFCIELPSIELTEAIEIIPVTANAEKILKSVKTWKM